MIFIIDIETVGLAGPLAKGDKVIVRTETDLVGVAGLSMHTQYEIEEVEPRAGLVVIKNDNGFLKTYDADRFEISGLSIVEFP